METFEFGMKNVKKNVNNKGTGNVTQSVKIKLLSWINQLLCTLVRNILLFYNSMPYKLF